MAERRLPPSLPALLREETFERARVERIWHAIAAQRAQRAPRLAQRVTLGLGLALAGALATGVWVMGEQLAPLPSQRSAPAASLATSITRSDGSALGSLSASAAQPLHVALSDGSSVEVQPHGLLSPVELSASRVVLRLQRGATRFAVRPGGPRRWVIEAGPATVEVIGTRFEVLREPAGTRVRVQHGKVQVSAQGPAGGVVQLLAGQAVLVGADGVGAITALPATPAAPAAPITQAVPAAEASMPATPPTRAASPGAASAGAATRIEALLAEADLLRLARDPEAAARVLLRVLREHADDPRAGLAAFTLARLREQSLDDARGAADAYGQALELGLSPTLAQSARAHLVHAWLAAGQGEAALRAARDYLTRHPDGADASSLRALLKQLQAQPALPLTPGPAGPRAPSAGAPR